MLNIQTRSSVASTSVRKANGPRVRGLADVNLGVGNERSIDCIAGSSGERISGKRELDKTSYLFQYNNHPSYQFPIDQPFFIYLLL
jgi:hypothetical protein